MSSNNLNAKTCLGFVGLGAIGLPIASNILRAGFRLQVHTRSRKTERRKELEGAKPCSSPKEVAKDCNFLLICVTDDNAVEEVLFGSEGAENSLNPGAIVIDLSTISPCKSKIFAQRLAKKKRTLLAQVERFKKNCVVRVWSDGAEGGGGESRNPLLGSERRLKLVIRYVERGEGGR